MRFNGRTPLVILGMASILAIAGFATWSAFTATTKTEDNHFASATVVLSQGQSGSAVFNVTGLVPGAPEERCVKVGYTGADATVAMYTANVSGALGAYLNVAIEKGTGDAADCSDFVKDADVQSPAVALTSLPTSWASGLDSRTWSDGDATTYRIVADVADDNAAQDASVNADFVWEAHS